MTSRVAKVFLLIALLYALFTAGEMWMTIQLTNNGYEPAQGKIFQITSILSRWAIDPLFMCGTAAMIEFLERIWRELAKANERSAAKDGNS